MKSTPSLLEISIATPLGLMRGAVSASGVHALHFPEAKTRQQFSGVPGGTVHWHASQRSGPKPSPGHLLQVERLLRWLLAYFSGQVPLQMPQLDFTGLSPFTQTVIRELLKIGPGRTTTYGALAAAAGSPGGARAVGGVMRANRQVLLVPCHRVLGSGPSGKAPSLGGFSGGLDLKRQLLAYEGSIPD